MQLDQIGRALIAAGNVLCEGDIQPTAKSVEKAVEIMENSKGPVKKKRARRTKAQVEADKLAAQAKTDVKEEKAIVEGDNFDDFEEFSEAEVTPESDITEDMVRKRCVEVAQKQGKEFVYKVLGNFGVQKLNMLPPDKYSAVYNQLQ